MSIFANTKEDDKTEEHMDNPQYGDVFSEMCNLWLYIIENKNGVILTVERVGNDLKVIQYNNPTIFKKRFAYGSIAGYWIMLYWTGKIKSCETALEAAGGREKVSIYKPKKQYVAPKCCSECGKPL